MANKKMKVNLYGTNYSITRIEVSRYAADKTVAIQLYSWCNEYGGFEEPFASLTVCLNLKKANNPKDFDDAEEFMDAEEFKEDLLSRDDISFLDTNNCPWGEDFVSKYELGVPTGIYQSSGYCTYPLYKWNLEKLNQYAMEVK